MPDLRDFVGANDSSKPVDISEYRLAQEITHRKLGDILLLKQIRGSHTICLRERAIETSAANIEKLKYMSQLSSQYLLEIYGFKQAQLPNSIQIYFESYQSDLEREIQLRITEKTTFSEEQLNILLFCAVNALSYLQENKTAHSCITPCSIFKVSDSYKIDDNCLINGDSSLYNQALSGQNLRYLAPELLEQVAKNIRAPVNYNPFKADIYSLGICLLDAGVLDEGELTLVDRKRMTLGADNLEKRLIRFKSRYSAELSLVVEGMIQIQNQKRPDAVSIYNRMPSKAREGKKRIFEPLESWRLPEINGIQHAKLRQTPEITTVQGDALNRRPNNNSHHAREASGIFSQYKDSRRDDSLGSAPKGLKQEADYANINVSDIIKRDPVLSKFLERMYNKSGEKERNQAPELPSRQENPPVLSIPYSSAEQPYNFDVLLFIGSSSNDEID